MSRKITRACHHNCLYELQIDYSKDNLILCIKQCKLPDHLNFAAPVTSSENLQDRQSKQVIKLHPKLP